MPGLESESNSGANRSSNRSSKRPDPPRPSSFRGVSSPLSLSGAITMRYIVGHCWHQTVLGRNRFCISFASILKYLSPHLQPPVMARESRSREHFPISPSMNCNRTVRTPECQLVLLGKPITCLFASRCGEEDGADCARWNFCNRYQPFERRLVFFFYSLKSNAPRHTAP